MAGKLKEVVSGDVRALITQLSGFKEEDPNFKACEKFIQSHILYHRYLSVDSHSIRRSLEGIVLKFNLNGLFDKAQDLNRLAKTFLDNYKVKESSMVDIQWCLLSLLLNLAYNPTNANTEETCNLSSPSASSVCDEEIDWASYLKEGEEFFCDWNEKSDSGSDDEVDCIPTAIEQEPLLIPAAAKHIQSPSSHNPITSQPSNSRKDMKLHAYQNAQIAVISETWWKAHMQHTWWTKANMHHIPMSKHLASHSAYLLNQSKEESLSCSTLSEHKVVLEVLWSIYAPSDSAVFMEVINDSGKGNYCVRPHITIPSLSQDVFSFVLGSLCRFIDIIKTLRKFSAEIFNADHQQKSPLTYQAYDAALQIELQPFFELITRLEQCAHKQKETLTILNTLDRLYPWLQKLSDLYDFHQKAILNWKEHPNWLCTTQLLSVLLAHLRDAKGNSVMIIRIFIRTFKVYMNIADQWLTEGKLFDGRDEFLITRCENKTDLLGAVFEKRDWEREVAALGIEAPSVLCILTEYLLKAAQPLHVLHHLNRFSELQKRRSARCSLYFGLVGNIIACLENYQPFGCEKPVSVVSEIPWWDQVDRYLNDKTAPIAMKSRGNDKVLPKISWMGDDFMFDHFLRLEDPLMYEGFQFVFNSSPSGNTIACSDPDSQRLQDENSMVDKLIDIIKVLPEILPLESCLERAMHNLSADWEEAAGAMVADILMREQQLLLHIQVAQSVFLMQAGHTLQPFLSHFFKMMMQREDMVWTDSHSLSVLLQDCMDSDHFSVSVQTGNRPLNDISVLDCIDCLHFNYQVEWPLSAILGDRSEKAYNAIFRILLKLRWGLWNLEHISLRGMPDCSFTQRLLHLRFRLLHLVRSCYGFLSGHILNVLWLKFSENVQKAKDLHSIIQVHDKLLSDAMYLSFRAEAPDAVKSALYQLVVLAENLYFLWTSDPSDVNIKKLSNMESCYADCHMFLVIALDTLVQEEGLQHLAYLNDLVYWNVPSHRISDD